MDMNHIHAYARKLVEAHGQQAELEAASRLKQAESGGNPQEVENWRRIRSAVRERKGANAS